MSVGFSRPGVTYPYRNWGTSSGNNYAMTLDPTAGEYSVTSSTLVGKTILFLARTGVIYRLSDSPSGREYYFDSSTGTITFAVAFNTNEDIIINYR